jgi:hypothetical protein
MTGKAVTFVKRTSLGARVGCPTHQETRSLDDDTVAVVSASTVPITPLKESRMKNLKRVLFISAFRAQRGTGILIGGGCSSFLRYPLGNTSNEKIVASDAAFIRPVYPGTFDNGILSDPLANWGPAIRKE